MAKKATPVALSPKVIKDIWQQISPSDWLSILEEFKPDNDWKLTGNTIKGRCPFHEEHTPSFYVDLNKKSAHCYGACSSTHWNPIKFYSDISNKGYAEAAKELQKRYNLRLPTAYTRHAQQIDDNEHVKLDIFRAAREELLDLVQAPNSQEFAYAKELNAHGDLLRRKLPLDTLHLLPTGILPPAAKLGERIKSYSGKKAVVPALNYIGKYLERGDNSCVGAFLFAYYTSPTTIGRLKLRIPKPAETNKTVVYVIEDKFADTVGVLGLNSYPHLLNSIDNYPLIVVEGEFDMLSVLAHQALDISRGEMFVVANGGKMELDLESLMQFGFKTIHLIPDNDQGGISWAKELIKNNKSVTKVFKWPAGFSRVKDVDIAIRSKGYGDAIDMFQDSKRYLPTHIWAVDTLSNQLRSVDDGDVAEKYRVAAELGSILPSVLQMEYAKEAAQTLDLDRSTIVDNMVIEDDTPQGFIRRLRSRLQQEYHIMSQEQLGKSSVVHAWSKTKRVGRTLHTESHSSLRGALSLDLGQLEEYIREYVGEPQFLKFKTTPKGDLIPLHPLEKSKLVGLCFSQALESLAAEATPVSALDTLGPGIHYYEEVDGAPSVLYIANGTYFFRGEIKGSHIQYTEVDCPMVDGFTFKTGRQEWSKNLGGLDDIAESLNYDPVELYQKIVRLLADNWVFKEGELDAKYVAAHVLYSPIAAVFNFMVKMAFNGMSHSGKTTLMQFLGGDKYPGYRLCESAMTIDNYTSAGVQQLMSNTVLWLLLDEFEHLDSDAIRGDRKNAAVRDILDATRDTDGGNRRVRGTPHGDAVTSRNWFPMTVGGIQPMHEYHDVNRFVHIDLLHVVGKNDPMVGIKEAYTPEDMRELRRGITLCWLQRIPQVIQAFHEVQQEFADNAKLPKGVFTRLKVNYLPIATIMKLVGEDYRKFIEDYISVKVASLTSQGSAQESEVLWTELLNAHIPKRNLGMDMSGGIISLSKLISDTSISYTLNEADLGAYFIPQQQWLVVHWPRVISGILSRSSRYRGTKHPQRLKKIADAHQDCVPPAKITDEFITLLNPMLGLRVKADEISILNVKNIITYCTSASTADDQHGNQLAGVSVQDEDEVPDANLIRGTFK